MNLLDLIHQQFPIKIHYFCSPPMAGMKKACWMNQQLYVSPAMYNLLQNEKGEVLERIAAKIDIVDVGNFDPLHEPLPMVTQPPVTLDGTMTFRHYRKDPPHEYGGEG